MMKLSPFRVILNEVKNLAKSQAKSLRGILRYAQDDTSDEGMTRTTKLLSELLSEASLLNSCNS